MPDFVSYHTVEKTEEDTLFDFEIYQEIVGKTVSASGNPIFFE